MDYRVCGIDDNALKRTITENVLRALPDWFGIEESIIDYVEKSEGTMFWAAYAAERPVGFLSLLRHNAYTSEIYCMGILQAFHHRGIGTALVQACENYCKAQGTEFLTVKTLDESRPDDGYAKTRQFYLALGFRPIEVFPTLWDEANPCLFMAKSVNPLQS